MPILSGSSYAIARNWRCGDPQIITRHDDRFGGSLLPRDITDRFGPRAPLPRRWHVSLRDRKWPLHLLAASLALFTTPRRTLLAQRPSPASPAAPRGPLSLRSSKRVCQAGRRHHVRGDGEFAPCIPLSSTETNGPSPNFKSSYRTRTTTPMWALRRRRTQVARRPRCWLHLRPWPSSRSSGVCCSCSSASGSRATIAHERKYFLASLSEWAC